MPMRVRRVWYHICFEVRRVFFKQPCVSRVQTAQYALVKICTTLQNVCFIIGCNVPPGPSQRETGTQQASDAHAQTTTHIQNHATTFVSSILPLRTYSAA